MKCPACPNDLTPLKVGKFEVDACQQGCGGIWFDAFELQQVDEAHETEGNVLFHIPTDPAVVVDRNQKRNCPRCDGIKLRRHFFSRKRQVEVDHCPNCGGYWLDDGELEIIQQEKTGATKALHQGERSISSDFIRYIYRLHSESARE